MIRVEGLCARAGDFRLADVTFEVPAGGYGVVIGPAGSGKTTLLEAIAGLAPLTAGRTWLGGEDAGARAPEGRAVGLVYQHAYLFPHRTVRENVAHGAADGALVDELLARFGVQALAGRGVARLSGGERQLVALARALATRPRTLLLDEPFSALDPGGRQRARREVRALHRSWGLTTLQVTHDFAEAGQLGDIAIVLDRGRVLQAGPPAAVFRRPASPYIAEFLGAENVLAGTVQALPGEAPLPASPDGEARPLVAFTTGGLTLQALGPAPEGAAVHAIIRADEVVVARTPPASSARNVFRGTVREVAVHGAHARVTLDVDGVPLVAALTARSVEELALVEGATAWASFKAMAVHLC